MNLLLCLLRGDTHKQQLLDVILDEANEGGEQITEEAALKRFEEDRDRLRTWFECEIDYNRVTQRYELISINRPLLDLPPSGIQTLAFLQRTFEDNTTPKQEDVERLLRHIIQLMPQSSRKHLQAQRGLLEIALKSRDNDNIPQETFNIIQMTCAERRQLIFDYRSLQNTDMAPRRHTVEPMRYFFDPAHSHYYLEAYCLQTQTASGIQYPQQIITYRLGRMANLQALPTRFIPRTVPEKRLAYILSASIARGGVSKRIPQSEIIPQADGSVLVEAVSRNLFFDLRSLLHYGDNCLVIGGDEAVSQMRALVQGLYNRYF